MSSAQYRQAHYIRVFLNRRVGDHLGSLVQPGINHFHAGIAERRGNHLGATVVTIQPRLGNEYANRTRH